MRAIRALVVAAVVCLVPVAAVAAPGKAWTAAKSNLPRGTEVVIGLDLTQLTKTMLFKMALPVLLSKQPDIKQGLDDVKATCGIDPMKNIEAVVVGTDKDQKQGAVFLAVNGLDETAIVTCLKALASKDSVRNAPVTATTTGGITELNIDGKKAYLRWIGKDVLVLPLELTDRTQLEKWTGNKAGLKRAAVGKYLGKVNTRSALWAVSAVPQDLDGTQMKAGYGVLATTKGNLVPDLHVVMADASVATATADKANQELATLANGSGLAADLKTMLQAVKVTSAGDEVIVKATIAEKHLLSLAGTLMRGM